MDSIEIAPGTRVELDCKRRALLRRSRRGPSPTRGPATSCLFEDPTRNIALAINGGNAAEMLAARPGDTISIRRASP